MVALCAALWLERSLATISVASCKGVGVRGRGRGKGVGGKG